MRFAIYLTLLIAVLPIVLTRPFFGLCAYYVISLLQPKLLAWQPVFPDAMLVGVPMVIGAVCIGVRRMVPKFEPSASGAGRIGWRAIRSPLLEPSWLLGACALLLAYITINRLVAPFPLSNSSEQYRSLCKVLVVVALLTGLTSDYRRFRTIYLVVAMSVAFWAIKGGLKVLVLGPHQVYGRTYDNNLFALTSVMTLPMVFYFGLSVKHARWRAVLMGCSLLMCLAIIGSRSRAGFAACTIVLAMMGWSSRYRWKAMIAVGIFAAAAAVVSGAEIRDRIRSIAEYKQDRSARSRFASWEVALDVLKRSPAVGIGFQNFELAKDALVGGRKAAHNIYLQNLAELGIVGHPLWLTVVLGSLATSWLFMRWARRLPPEMRWAYYWSRGLMLGLLAFCIHGMFHNEEYLELMFVMVGLVVALQVATRRELWRMQAGQGSAATIAPRAIIIKRPAAVHPGRLWAEPALR